jgi:hypothetical protein
LGNTSRQTLTVSRPNAGIWMAATLATQLNPIVLPWNKN